MPDAPFDIPETLSPRLAWMKRHGIALVDNGTDLKTDGDFPERRYCAHEAGKIGPWPDGCAGWGDTQDDALLSLCAKLNLKHWMEA